MATQQAPNPFIPLIFIALIFYFVVARPEQKRKKEFKQKISNLKKNDEVVTSGGIHGTVTQVKDATIVLRVDDNVKIEFEKDSVITIKAKDNS